MNDLVRSDDIYDSPELDGVEESKQPQTGDIWLDLEESEDTPRESCSVMRAQMALAKVFKAFPYNALIIALIITDVVLLVIRNLLDLTRTHIIWWVSFVLSGLFVFELALRIFAFGKHFFRSFWAYLDSILVLACLLLYIDENFQVMYIVKHTTIYIGVILQGARALLRLILQSTDLKTSARHLVGQNKMRYCRDGFDLDLAYITRNIIAMGVPSVSVESMYRNPIKEVARFFSVKHPESYLILNLCTERSYPTAPFQGRVARFMFDDHNPPLMPTALHLLHRVHHFLALSEQHVVAVHCKGGKGRTGTVVCMLLLALYPSLYAPQVLRLFADKRTDDRKRGGKLQGVAGPSQIRYVQYLEQLREACRIRRVPLEEGWPLLVDTPAIELISLGVHGCFPSGRRGGGKGGWRKGGGVYYLVITYYPASELQGREGKQTRGERVRRRDKEKAVEGVREEELFIFSGGEAEQGDAHARETAVAGDGGGAIELASIRIDGLGDGDGAGADGSGVGGSVGAMTAHGRRSVSRASSPAAATARAAVGGNGDVDAAGAGDDSGHESGSDGSEKESSSSEDGGPVGEEEEEWRDLDVFGPPTTTHGSNGHGVHKHHKNKKNHASSHKSKHSKGSSAKAQSHHRRTPSSTSPWGYPVPGTKYRGGASENGKGISKTPYTYIQYSVSAYQEKGVYEYGRAENQGDGFVDVPADNFYNKGDDNVDKDFADNFYNDFTEGSGGPYDQTPRATTTQAPITTAIASATADTSVTANVAAAGSGGRATALGSVSAHDAAYGLDSMSIVDSVRAPALGSVSVPGALGSVAHPVPHSQQYSQQQPQYNAQHTRQQPQQAYSQQQQRHYSYSEHVVPAPPPLSHAAPPAAHGMAPSANGLSPLSSAFATLPRGFETLPNGFAGSATSYSSTTMPPFYTANNQYAAEAVSTANNHYAASGFSAHTNTTLPQPRTYSLPPSSVPQPSQRGRHTRNKHTHSNINTSANSTPALGPMPTPAFGAAFSPAPALGAALGTAIDPTPVLGVGGGPMAALGTVPQLALGAVPFNDPGMSMNMSMGVAVGVPTNAHMSSAAADDDVFAEDHRRTAALYPPSPLPPPPCLPSPDSFHSSPSPTHMSVCSSLSSSSLSPTSMSTANATGTRQGAGAGVYTPTHSGTDPSSGIPHTRPRTNSGVSSVLFPRDASALLPPVTAPAAQAVENAMTALPPPPQYSYTAMTSAGAPLPRDCDLFFLLKREGPSSDSDGAPAPPTSTPNPQPTSTSAVPAAASTSASAASARAAPTPLYLRGDIKFEVVEHVLGRRRVVAWWWLNTAFLAAGVGGAGAGGSGVAHKYSGVDYSTYYQAAAAATAAEHAAAAAAANAAAEAEAAALGSVGRGAGAGVYMSSETGAGVHSGYGVDNGVRGGIGADISRDQYPAATAPPHYTAPGTSPRYAATGDGHGFGPTLAPLLEVDGEDGEQALGNTNTSSTATDDKSSMNADIGVAMAHGDGVNTGDHGGGDHDNVDAVDGEGDPSLASAAALSEFLAEAEAARAARDAALAQRRQEEAAEEARRRAQEQEEEARRERQERERREAERAMDVLCGMPSAGAGTAMVPVLGEMADGKKEREAGVLRNGLEMRHITSPKLQNTFSESLASFPDSSEFPEIPDSGLPPANPSLFLNITGDGTHSAASTPSHIRHGDNTHSNAHTPSHARLTPGRGLTKGGTSGSGGGVGASRRGLGGARSRASTPARRTANAANNTAGTTMTTATSAHTASSSSLSSLPSLPGVSPADVWLWWVAHQTRAKVVHTGHIHRALAAIHTLNAVNARGYISHAAGMSAGAGANSGEEVAPVMAHAEVGATTTPMAINTNMHTTASTSASALTALSSAPRAGTGKAPGASAIADTSACDDTGKNASIGVSVDASAEAPVLVTAITSPSATVTPRIPRVTAIAPPPGSTVHTLTLHHEDIDDAGRNKDLRISVTFVCDRARVCDKLVAGMDRFPDVQRGYREWEAKMQQKLQTNS